LSPSLMLFLTLSLYLSLWLTLTLLTDNFSPGFDRPPKRRQAAIRQAR